MKDSTRSRFGGFSMECAVRRFLAARPMLTNVNVTALVGPDVVSDER